MDAVMICEPGCCPGCVDCYGMGVGCHKKPCRCGLPCTCAWADEDDDPEWRGGCERHTRDLGGTVNAYEAVLLALPGRIYRPHQVAHEVIAALEAAGYEVVPAGFVDGMRGIAARRCLSDGPCANHSHPQCMGGSCVTCQARAHVAHLDGDDPLGVFAGNL